MKLSKRQRKRDKHYRFTMWMVLKLHLPMDMAYDIASFFVKVN